MCPVCPISMCPVSRQSILYQGSGALWQGSLPCIKAVCPVSRQCAMYKGSVSCIKKAVPIGKAVCPVSRQCVLYQGVCPVSRPQINDLFCLRL